MTKEILFVRHGKAEDRTAGKSDADRELTEKGKDEFRSFVSSVKKELKTDKAVSVWTSPMKRAKQTAEILTEHMEWSVAKEKEFIVKGDFKVLMEEVKAMEPNTRIVCVGHKPIQGTWVKELTGIPYAFKKGGIALIRLNENDLNKGKLIWKGNPAS
ncbi:SixA phosphatase family protein [Alkalibacterium gilvum]|uniref:Phosphohistidine phosphatase, SixA n=1 Tax=Alkalibacterium gilvum TaxID=1130080 RepID=A0A1H6SHQ9_9LACT|nr:phosphoglycerate mutase family protein [Alkalibacterium gilvum]SEI63012.1 phosphohistidine phosphatase, SixA [Alkalibacterium gilvum]